MSETDSATEAGFAEIRGLIGNLPGPDLTAASKVATRERDLLKPPGALGRLEELTQWLATWQGRAPPRLEHPRIVVFAGMHGITDQGVSAYPAEVTRQMVAGFIDGVAAINQIAGQLDADLQIHEMDLDHPVADFTLGPAMDEARCARAMAYGMMAVEPGIDLLCLGEMGIGNTTSAAALCCALFGGAPADWAGPGTGLRAEEIERKAKVIARGLEVNADLLKDPLDVLCAFGGEELAAIAGAVLAARMARVPVMLDGFACTAAAAVLYRLDHRVLDHCKIAHRSAEPGHTRLLERLDKRPLLDLGLRLGEGTGAALAVPLLRAALACHTDMATFAEAGVTGPVR